MDPLQILAIAVPQINGKPLRQVLSIIKLVLALAPLSPIWLRRTLPQNAKPNPISQISSLLKSMLTTSITMDFVVLNVLQIGHLEIGVVPVHIQTYVVQLIQRFHSNAVNGVINLTIFPVLQPIASDTDANLLRRQVMA